MEIIAFFQQQLDLHGIGWMVGQGLGIVAIVLGFISYQVRTQRQLLFVQSAVSIVFCIHYCLIGAYSAMAMNSICIIRNIAYSYRTQKGIKNKLLPIGFVIIQAIMCFLTWEAWYSICVYAKSKQNKYRIPCFPR